MRRPRQVAAHYQRIAKQYFVPRFHMVSCRLRKGKPRETFARWIPCTSFPR